MYPMRAAQFDATDPANNAQGNTNSANANGTTAKGANPVATNNKAAGAGSPAAVGPRVSACDINGAVKRSPFEESRIRGWEGGMAEVMGGESAVEGVECTL
jgi:hypothetical protein